VYLLPLASTTLDAGSRVALAEAVDVSLKLPVGSSKYMSDTLYEDGKPRTDASATVGSASVSIVSHVKTTVLLGQFPSYRESPRLLFNRLHTNLTAAVNNGDFVRILNSLSLLKYATLTSTATIGGNVTAINLVIYLPSTDSPSSQDNYQSFSLLSPLVISIIGIAAAIVLAVLGAAVLCYRCSLHQQKKGKTIADLKALSTRAPSFGGGGGGGELEGVGMGAVDRKVGKDANNGSYKGPERNAYETLNTEVFVPSGDSIEHDFNNIHLRFNDKKFYLSKFRSEHWNISVPEQLGCGYGSHWLMSTLLNIFIFICVSNCILL
jgi:hypothetical protein